MNKLKMKIRNVKRKDISNSENEKLIHEQRKFEKTKRDFNETKELVKFHEFSQLMLSKL
jgi:uncharacterized protein YozE (UPF0346 family)